MYQIDFSVITFATKVASPRPWFVLFIEVFVIGLLELNSVNRTLCAAARNPGLRL